jgi:hypothetical protein
MKIVLVIVLVAWLAGVAAWWASRRPSRSLSARERAELDSSRAVLDGLLAAALEVSDVDPVLAPRVIDDIRAHQRSLTRRTG